MCLKYCKSKYVILGEKRILIRRPKLSDVKSFLQLINSIIKEDAMIITNRKFTFEEEKAWIKTCLDNIRKNKLHMLVADYMGEIIGDVFINKSDFRQSHVAEYHIGVKKNYRNIGLGTILSNAIIDIAKKDSDIKILQLNVPANNRSAMRLYKKLGFKKVSILPSRFFYRGKYINLFVMDYPLNKI